jgi:hypothetical protein
LQGEAQRGPSKQSGTNSTTTSTRVGWRSAASWTDGWSGSASSCRICAFVIVSALVVALLELADRISQ